MKKNKFKKPFELSTLNFFSIILYFRDGTMKGK